MSKSKKKVKLNPAIPMPPKDKIQISDDGMRWSIRDSKVHELTEMDLMVPTVCTFCGWRGVRGDVNIYYPGRENLESQGHAFYYGEYVGFDEECPSCGELGYIHSAAEAEEIIREEQEQE